MISMRKSTVSESIAVAVITKSVMLQMGQRLSMAIDQLAEEINFGIDPTTLEGKEVIEFATRMEALRNAIDALPLPDHVPVLTALSNAGLLDTTKVDYQPGRSKITLAGVLS